MSRDGTINSMLNAWERNLPCFASFIGFLSAGCPRGGGVTGEDWGNLRED